MRFSRLELLKYGQLENCVLDFAQQAPDLHIIFGRNEAGKSTTLAAISDLLFEFGHTTPYAFLYDRQLLRVGAVLEDDSSKTYFRRKKARAGSSLIDADERSIDEGRLTALLAGQTRESFHRMFSLNHLGLRDGGQAILDAKDDIGKAIFAAGSGLVSVSGLLANLEADAKQIWAKRAAGSQEYRLASKAYEDARARLKQAQIKPAAWDQLRREVEETEATIAEKRSAREAKETERKKLERRRRTLVPIGQYKQVQTELGELAQYTELPATAAATLESALGEVSTAETKSRLAKEQIEEASQAVSELIFEQLLIDSGAEIEALRVEQGAVDKALRDLPRRELELTTAQDSLKQIQKELGWAAEEASVAQSRLPRKIDVTELRSHVERHTALEALLSKADGEHTAALDNAEEAKQQVENLGDAIDISALLIALEVAQSKGDMDASVAAAQLLLNRKREKLTVELAKLTPWNGDVSDLEKIILPTDAEISEAVSQSYQVENRLSELDTKLTEAEERRNLLRLQRDQMLRDNGAVSPQALIDSRSERDLLWQMIRGHIIGEEALQDPPSTADKFQNTVEVADNLADQRYMAAEQSGRLAATIEDLERTELSISQIKEEITKYESRKNENDTNWRQRIALLKVGLSPQDFSAWLERRSGVLNAVSEVRGAEDELAEKQRIQRECKTELVTNISTLDAEFAIAPEATQAALVKRAQSLKRNAEQLEAKRIELTTTSRNSAATVKKTEKRKNEAQDNIEKWQAAWIPAVGACGLDPKASVAVVREQLTLLDEARKKIDEIVSLSHRVMTMKEDIKRFAERVTRVASSCGLKAEADNSADTLVSLSGQLAEAITFSVRKTELESQIAGAKERASEADNEKALAVGRLEPLMKAVGITEYELLAPFVEHSAQSRSLKTKLGELSQQIIAAGEGMTLEGLIADSSGADAVELKATLDGLQDESTALTSEIEDLTQKLTTAKNSFITMDNAPAASIEAADMELARSEMVLHAERYVRKQAQVTLLSWAIERYRAEKQDPLLTRASDLFSLLTLGRYTKLLPDPEATSRLSGLSGDGRVVPVGNMSEGTIDQLFLALRVAAVEDAVASGIKLPFLADDLLINYDDGRAGAGFKVLADLAKTTQVLFFTHHRHLVDIARASLAPAVVSECTLPEPN